MGSVTVKYSSYLIKNQATFCLFYIFPLLSGFTSLETRDDETAEREELRRLISTLHIEKVRKILKELR